MSIFYLGVLNCAVDAMKQVSAIENDLKIESTDVIFANISKASLKAAAELFIYLNPIYAKANECSFNAFNTWFDVWLPFYNDLFKTQSADKIILTLNRLTKTTTQPSKIVAEDIFMRTATILSLKYQFIQSRMPQRRQNSAHLEDFHISDNSEGKLKFSVFIMYETNSNFQCLPLLTIQFIL